jgi:uroporphyrin-III C-methyltransferase/precorrin-2 dehydrogenase/sirohydrochlorin ferrochelatase/uroporphyrin-III C-methyltransferase
VRLKGGDVSIFSNILDELKVLVDNNIAYEIIPGITAALGAAAYGGIPLTARNYSKSVRFLTYHPSVSLDENYWQDLAQTDDTLVFYMSSGTLPEVVSHLVKNKISADKLLAVIEQATTPQQKVHVTDIYKFDETLKGKKFASPSLIIIGKVVALHQQFQWRQNNPDSGLYFQPLAQLPVSQFKKENNHVSAA